MNSNLFHNIANVAMVLVAAASAAMTAIGCTAAVNGQLECTNTVLISPTTAGVIVAVIGAAKIVVNIVRDGIAGLAKQQPPVK